MSDYLRAFGAFLFFGPPVILMFIGGVSLFICLTIFLKRLILRQNDSDWLGGRGVIVAILIFAAGLGIGSLILSHLN